MTRPEKLSRSRLEISAFASGGQSFLSNFLATILPIIPLALATGALIIAVSLSSPLNLEEIPALSIGANSKVTRLKELSSDYAIQ